MVFWLPYLLRTYLSLHCLHPSKQTTFSALKILSDIPLPIHHLPFSHLLLFTAGKLCYLLCPHMCNLSSRHLWTFSHFFFECCFPLTSAVMPLFFLSPCLGDVILVLESDTVTRRLYTESLFFQCSFLSAIKQLK